MAFSLTSSAGLVVERTDPTQISITVTVPRQLSGQASHLTPGSGTSLDGSLSPESPSFRSSGWIGESEAEPTPFASSEAAADLMTAGLHAVTSLLAAQFRRVPEMHEMAILPDGEAPGVARVVDVGALAAAVPRRVEGSEMSEEDHAQEHAALAAGALIAPDLFSTPCRRCSSSSLPQMGQLDLSMGSFTDLATLGSAPATGKSLVFASARDMRYDLLLLRSLAHRSVKSDVVVHEGVARPSFALEYPGLGTLQHVLNAACDAQVSRGGAGGGAPTHGISRPPFPLSPWPRLTRGAVGLQVVMQWPAVHTIILDIAEGLRYIHAQLGIGLGGLDARDIFVYSLQSASRPMVKISTARLCRRAVGFRSSLRLEDMDAEDLPSQPLVASDEEQSFAHADVAAYGILVYVIVTHLQRLKTVGRNARDRRLERLITRQRSYLFLVRVVCVVHVDGCSGWCSNPPPHSHADVPDLCPWAQRVSEVEASSMHVGIADLITDCCQQDPNFRIGMDEVWAALAALERCPKAFLTCFQSMCCGRQACARLHAPEMRQLRHALELPPHAGVRCAETLPAGTTWICCENQVPRACVAVPMEGGWKPHCGWFRRTGCDSGGRILAGLSTNQERLVMLKPSVGPSLFQWQCKPSLWEFVCREGGVVISLRTALTDVD